MIPTPYYELSISAEKNICVSRGSANHLFNVWQKTWKWTKHPNKPDAQILNFVGERQTHEDVDWEAAKGIVQSKAIHKGIALNVKFPENPDLREVSL